LIFTPPIAAIALNPFGVKDYLQKLSPNIHVKYSPKGEEVKFSHHQKFVVIDRLVSFLGGIDLCIGRYNEPGSRLDDVEAKTYIGIFYSLYYQK